MHWKVGNAVSTATIQLQTRADQVKSKAEETESQLQSTVREAESKTKGFMSSASLELQGKQKEAEDGLAQIQGDASRALSNVGSEVQVKSREASDNLQQFNLMGLGALAAGIPALQGGGGTGLQAAPSAAKDALSGFQDKSQDLISTLQEIPHRAQSTMADVQTKARDVLSDLKQLPASALGAFAQAQTGQNAAGSLVEGLQTAAADTLTKVVDGGASDINEAVVKIQAGVRGYLTRKSLKEKKSDKDGAEIGGALLPDIGVDSAEKDVMDFLRGQPDIQTSGQLDERELLWLEDERHHHQQEEEEGDAEKQEEEAATKIQAAFKGYKVRKNQQHDTTSSSQ